MASAWGSAWGDSWGDSWGTITTPQPARGTAAWLSPSLYAKPKTKEQVRKEREDLGILPKAIQVIKEVAQRQVQRLELDEQKRFDELLNEIKLQELQWDARYLALLSEERERLISEEIAARLQAKLNDERLMMLILMAAAA